MKISHLLLASTVALLALGGCRSSRPGSDLHSVTGESIVLVGQQPARLAFPPLRPGTVRVRNSYREALPQTIRYEEGEDFIVNYDLGHIRRTAQSRIPDFGTNMLFGVEDFDHGKFPGFGNTHFFAFVDYASQGKVQWLKQASQVEFLGKTQAKLRGGEPVKIVAFGDSITTGGDATDPKLGFWQRWADHLQAKYPSAKVEAINGATGGDRTGEGLQRFTDKVVSQKPDLVLIGFGMNDHNIGGYGTPLETFSSNLATIIERIRKETGAEIIVYSTFPPNPKWHYGSGQMEKYALATEKVAVEKGCAFGDVYRNWLAIESRKKPEDLLGNNINHPNDFGHWIYFEVLKALGL